MYYSRAVDNKLLFGLSAISAKQAFATQHTNEAINQILNYSATYPTDGVVYCSSDMVLCDHSHSVFHNKIKGRSRAGAHISLSENDPMPKWNSPVLNLSQIIKLFMSSASEAELGELYITAQEIVLMRNTLEEMRWPQPKSLLQTENSATAGLVNNTIVPRKLKAMDRHLHWLRFR